MVKIYGFDCVMAAEGSELMLRPQQKQYDYLLKFLLVGDSDVGKKEILSGLDDGSSESPFCSGSGELHSHSINIYITRMRINRFICLSFFSV